MARGTRQRAHGFFEGLETFAVANGLCAWLDQFGRDSVPANAPYSPHSVPRPERLRRCSRQPWTNEISLWRRAVPGRGKAEFDGDLFVYKADSVLRGNLGGTGAIQLVVLFLLKAPNILGASGISRARPHSVGQHPFARKWADRLGCRAGWDRGSDPGGGGIGCGHRSALSGLARCG